MYPKSHFKKFFHSERLLEPFYMPFWIPSDLKMDF